VKPYELAERLFQRQETGIRDAISRADGEERRWFVKRVLSLHNDAGEHFMDVDLRAFAQSTGLIPDRKRFDALLSKRREEDVISRARRVSASRPLTEMFYFPHAKKPFFWHGTGSGFTSGGKEDALEELKRLGFSDLILPGSRLPEARAFLIGIINQPIDYAGGIAGIRAGLHRIGGKNILVTSSPDLLVPQPGAFPAIQEFLRSRLDLGRESELGIQTNILLDWLHFAARDLYTDGKYRPAQVLALIGQRRAGKDVLANDIIAPLLGGRLAKPMAKFKGETRFSDELVASENWHISDELDSVSPKTKAALEEALKQAAVSPALRLEGKFGTVVSVPTYRRLVITCNDDRTSMEYFPGLRENFADKIIMLDVRGAAFFGPETPWATFADWKPHVDRELPAFLHYLLHEHVVPVARADAHYRVASYHNPFLAGVLLELDPATPLHEIIVNSGIWGPSSDFVVDTSAGHRTVTTTATGLLAYLRDNESHAMAGLDIKAANHLGRLLAKLVADRPEFYRQLPPLHGTTRYAIRQPEARCSPEQDERERVALAGFSS